MASLNGALDAGDERDAALARVAGDARVLKLAVVESNRERVEAQSGRAIHQVGGSVGDLVHRVVAGAEMEAYFQHIRAQSGRRIARSGGPPSRIAIGVPS